MVGAGRLSHGKVTITVKGSSLVKGANRLTVTYAPSGSFSAPKRALHITIRRTK